MSKPQVGTTFPFMELPGKQCCIWNDFRYPHAPISWGDLLNLLDNEAFLVVMPKGEGRKDHHWNATNGEKVFMVMTSNNPIVYCSDGALNQTETAAFNERFGSIYHFPNALAKEEQDVRYKQWGRCVRCYSDWILSVARGRRRARDDSDGDGEILFSEDDL